MPTGIPNKRYTGEFKEHMIKTMLEEKLSYTATSKRFEANDHHRIQAWERIYLEEGPEGFRIERRGRRTKGGERSLCNSKVNFYCLYVIMLVFIYTREQGRV